jgi:hypothetical protein
MAAWRGSIASMAALLDGKADMTATNRLGRTALHTAAYYGICLHCFVPLLHMNDYSIYRS